MIELEASSKNQETFQKEILKSLPPSVPVVLREIGVKIDIDRYVTGISYGVSRLIGSKYIGLRGEYDWETKGRVWLHTHIKRRFFQLQDLRTCEFIQNKNVLRGGTNVIL